MLDTRGVRLSLILLVFGCKRETPAPAAASARASSSAVAALSASVVRPPADAQLGTAPLKPPACRAIRVRGDLRSDTGPIAEMTPLDGRAWISLGEGEVAVRHGPSSRDFTLVGPGRFLPCRGGAEQVLIGSGRFKSSAGTGVRPGGEFTIATPFGSVSYGDADVGASIEAGRLTIEVRRGEVATEAVPGSKGLPKRLRGPNGSALVSGTPVPADLVGACERAATDAGSSAERLMGAGGRAELGKEAAAQLTDRRRARAVCASAEASLDRVTDPALRSRLETRVMAAERAWRSVPARPIAGPIPAR
jgi:hypothetical protein